MKRMGFILSAAVASLIVVLSGCSSPPGLDVSQRAAPARFDLVSETVEVAARTPLSPSDSLSLRRVVGGLAPSAAVHVLISHPAGTQPATITGVRKVLIDQGVPPTNVHMAQISSVAQGKITVTLHRHVVTPTTCSNYSYDSNRSSQDNARLGLGCSQQRNLELMVEDPRDLQRGRSLAPASGPREGDAVERYQTDEVKPLLGAPKPTTTN
jgi:pilus assembly protein CpaD